MSKRLNDAIASGIVVVRPRVAGEVVITFVNPEQAPIVLRSSENTELTRTVPAVALVKSNLRQLISRRLVRIVQK